MKRVTFLVPTYNRAGFLPQALDAIGAQLGRDDEVLVIDDGSTDATREVVSGRDPRVGYVYQENSGKSAALNLGLRLTSGAHVMICDDDDVLRPGAVDALFNTMERTDAGCAFGRYSRFREDAHGRRTDLGTGYWPDLAEGSILRHLLEDAFVMHNAALVRRAAYDAVGPFDESMLRSLDYDMFVRLALAVPMVFVDRLMFDQRKHDGVRGPGRALHSAATSEAVWQVYDRQIFLRLRDQVPLEAYERLFDGENHDQVRRAALLQRACVQARHGLWDLAVSDLDAAARQAPELPFLPLQAAISARMLNGKHGFADALHPDVLDRLKRLAREPGVGRAIIRAMLAGGLWRLRPPVPADAGEMRHLSSALVGSRTTLALLARRKLGGSVAPSRMAGLVERREPLASALG
ncbi:glycosyltransferase family 2 protein [Sphingomonas sp. S2-65]|uniref:glycosyltransferase family 2 protein n=1 Tax=Sphingomonas sp. S2-65 TaxID=2903960 RepID=UPI001F4236F2|nr:glycosyltransferase family 2 protein [Sphingomonas sp. S2-65]UYY57059.1 glycosyltransferase [Sphingomonas sp. S2-65]